jgi:hypothetical protein
MKRHGIFPGIILIGIGFYFLIEKLHLPYLSSFFTWPTLLLIVGIAFLAQSLFSNETSSLFPGVVLVGLGVHFHALKFLSFWPDHWGMYTFIIGIAYLGKYKKTKSGLLPGVLLLVISLLALFYDGVIGWLNWVGQFVGFFEQFWPIALITIGIYLIVFKK